jgi:hypothetical protein
LFCPFGILSKNKFKNIKLILISNIVDIAAVKNYLLNYLLKYSYFKDGYCAFNSVEYKVGSRQMSAVCFG